MADTVERAIAIVGVGAVLPDAPDVPTFWDNLTAARYSITEVDADRWDPAFYYDEDRLAPDKTYSKIGGWVREWDWSPLEWRLPIPPKVGDAMDRTQRWAIVAARQALMDYGHPGRPLDQERTAVVIGNAMGGDLHYLTALSVYYPEYADELRHAPAFAALAPDTQQAILDEMRTGVRSRFPNITEDTMPGELANIIAGRIANLFDFHGPNFVTDAACASAMAAIDAAVEGLEEGAYDAVLTGGVDANMSASTFVKFCKIGALSATGTRPFGEGADGFVMGEGAALFLLKRLADAERDGDHVYAVIRGIGGASDGRGKGITAPNPVGQRLAVQRAWKNAGIVPGAATMIEAHGTSTKVGDVVETAAIAEAFGDLGLPSGSIALGSVKSNIGHLKGAAGAAGMLKAALSLDKRMVPPSLNAVTPNPNIDFANSPLAVNTALREWGNGQVRSAGVSSFGFGGTNFHLVLEEHVPGRITVGPSTTSISVSAAKPETTELKSPLRGALVVGGASRAEVSAKLAEVQAAAERGDAPPPAPPAHDDLRAEVRVAIDYGDAADLAAKTAKAIKALDAGQPAMWKMLANQGVFHGEGPAHQVAMLYTGQGSQYVNMLAELRRTEPIVADAFDEADRIMEPLIGRPLTDIIFVDPDDEAAVAEATEQLRQTEITQPAVLTVDLALTRLLAAYGVESDMVMGHSLGEYGALVASGALPFADALEAVSARGREMANVEVADKGLMAAVFAPMEDVQRTIATIDEYVEVANINSNHQAVIGGSTAGVEAASAALTAGGAQVVPLPVSHAFHTSIVAPAAEPLRDVLGRLDLKPPVVPTVANVNGEFYPMGPAVVPDMIDILCQQIASPVQFIDGLNTLYEAGARTFIEVGPKRALHGFVEDVLGEDPEVMALYSNHPKTGDVVSFNQSLCGLYASGLGAGTGAPTPERAAPTPTPVAAAAPVAAAPAAPVASVTGNGDRYVELGRMFAEMLGRGNEILSGVAPASLPAASNGDGGGGEPVVITGAGIGLPGTKEVFDDGNLGRLLAGESFIDAIPVADRQAIVDKHITRLVKNESGGGSWETIDSQHDVVKLAGRRGHLDLAEQFGLPEERVKALDSSSELAIGAGIDALRDAGIPLTMHYKTTTTGSTLPERWGLPDSMRDETGIIFASAFPGLDRMTEEVTRYERDRARRARLADLTHLRSRISATDPAAAEIDHMIHEVQAEIDRDPYVFDRRFLFKILSMGHSQFAEHIGARGPNTQVNAACASTTQAVAIAEDWIRAGRCERVIIVSGDEATSDTLMQWIGAGFLASGAAATDDVVEEAALPFDRRRHGMLIGMGAAALVVESAASARERGIRPICQVLSAETANSAFHGSRLDVSHIRHVMEDLVAQAERRWGVRRADIARQAVFVSHETYTPARGGSAQAEVDALRFVFGEDADRIVVANTKGFTGHAMGVGVEDVLAVKALETGVVPPIANVKEVDPDLGSLNLSKGGAYPVTYALRLGAGFGSQISMSLSRWVPTPNGRRPEPDELGFDYRIEDRAAWERWLAEASGYGTPEIEVRQRTLRVRDDGPPTGLVARPARSVERAPDVVSAPPVAPPVEVPRAPAPTPPPAAPAAVTAPAPAPVAPAPAPVAAAVPEVVEDPVVTAVLEVVAAQTGYPAEMLELDLDLEADLGIDTVKQAETFAAIREHYGIERDDNLSLRDYPTLASVVGFVRAKAGLPEPAPVAEAAPAPAAAPAPVAAAAPAPVVDEVVEAVLGVVAAQTGYPAEMLELDLDLEADLGIDTVKQAETFAAIREEYGIERDDNLSLRDYPTLGHVVGFVRERATGLAGDAAAPAAAAPAAPTAAALPRGDLEATAEIARRVPTPFLRPDLELCVETGVELDEGAPVLVMADEGGVGRSLVGRLEQRGVDVLEIEDWPSADELLERFDAWLGDRALRGIYWLPALDVEADLLDQDIDEWREGNRRRVKLLFRLARHANDHLGAGTFVVSGTRLGGRHGYGPEGASAPMGGGVVGLTKAIKRERPDALVKAVDFPVSRKTAALADQLVEETLHDPGAMEVGRVDDRRWTIAMQEQELPDDERAIELGPDSSIVVTGAAGSIVSAIIGDLAEASGATFHLLDLAPAPDPDDADVLAFGTDRDGLKSTIFQRLKESGERATPALVEKELAGIERRHAALAALQAIEASGGTAHYHQVDLRDPEVMGEAMRSIVETSGKVDALIHAGGLEISRLMPDKSPEEYDLVFDVKADGWFNLLHGLGDAPLGSTVVFSSIAGRFGNGGQTDYSAANDLLCKQTSSFAANRPDTLGLAVDWTAWGDIGMATRGSIPQVMAAAGIDMLPAAAGIPFVRRELTSGGANRELVVAGRLGIMEQELHDTGGFDVGAEAIAERAAASGVTVGEVRSFGVGSGLVVAATHDPAQQPFLDDHRIDGTPVLPGVMGIESFASAAALAFPSLEVVAIEDVDFLAPFKFFRDEPREVVVAARFELDGDDVLARCRLIGQRTLPNQEEPQVTVHFTGTVRLGAGDDLGTAEVPPVGDGAVGSDAIYDIYFHGPAYQVMEQAWMGDGRMCGRWSTSVPPNTDPADAPLTSAPRWLELCFQTAGVWEIGTTGTMALPMHLDRVTLGEPAVGAEVTSAVVPGEDGSGSDAVVVDGDGRVRLRMEGYRTIALPGSMDDELVAPLRAATEENGSGD
ncbi:MAG: SDR family NAD(P)-dependent oxidoreductase [Actinomycetota bacterium]